MQGKKRHRITLAFGMAFILAMSGLSGLLTADSSPPETPGRLTEQEVAHLYFAAPDHSFLTAEERILPRPDDPAAYGKMIVEALIAGPQQDLMRTLPRETELRAVYVTENGTAYVDFTGSIRDHHPGGVQLERLSTYAIVNSLILNVDRIHTVKILIDGREARTLAGHIDIRFPFSANMLIIR